MKKKGLLGLAMCAMLVAPVAGCNKDKVEGVYDFDKIEIYQGKDTSKDPYKLLTCSQADLNDEVFGKTLCGTDGAVKDYKFDIKDEDTIVLDLDGEAEEYEYEIGDGGVMIIEGVSSQKDPKIIYKDGKVIMVVEFEAEVPVGDQSGLNQTMSGTFTAHAIFSK